MTELKFMGVERQPIEIVERKGTGHPDYICDAVMNEVSVALSGEYMKKFGTILHHNIDKGMIIAGETQNKFNGGSLVKPMLMLFGDRATFEFNSNQIPVGELAVKTAQKWFRENLRFVDPERHLKYQVEIRPGSQALTDIFERKSSILGANDTSAAVGFAPMTKTEQIVLQTERHLNSQEFKKTFPETGEDVKVMGYRRNGELFLTIALAFVDKFIDNEETYVRRKDEILDEVRSFVSGKSDFKPLHITINSADRPERGIGGLYLTVLGTSADGADCGQVGRGNRVNGIIPLNRPTCSEAAAGKNPVSHVGKIYNLLTYQIATEIQEKFPGVEEAYVWLLSEIGQPINNPQIASVQLVLDGKTRLQSIASNVRDVVQARLERIDKFCVELAEGKYAVC